MSFNRHRTAPQAQLRLALWVVGAFAILGGISLARGCKDASAAERYSDGPHEIVLFLPPLPQSASLVDHEANTRQNIFTLSAPYADRETCNRAKLRLVVMVKGGKMVCLPPETRRVN